MAKTRNRLLVVLSVLMAFAFMFGIFGFRTAKADSANMVTSFTMSESQSVRVDDHKGMRFYAVLSNTDYQNLFGSESNYEDVEFGYFIMPAYYEEILGDINEESTFGDQAVYTWEGKEGAGAYTVIHNVGAYPVLDTQGEISQGNYLIKGSVVNMYPQNLATKYTARMYVKATNKTTQATEYQFATKAKTTASMIDVAIKALDAGVQDDSLQGYIDSYNAWHTTEKGSAPTFTYTVNYVSGGEIVKSVVSEQSYAINTPVSITATAPEGYLLDQAMADSNVLSGKIFADNSLVLTVYVTNLTEETMEGSLYNKELYYFDKSSAEDASVVLPKAIGKVSALAIGGTVIDSANFSYEDATKTLTVKADAISALATGDVDMVITGATAIYTAKVTVADFVVNTESDLYTAFTAVDDSNKNNNYIVLADDITCVSQYTRLGVRTLGYQVFDGKGNVIKNLDVKESIFWSMQAGATFKNVAFIDAVNSGTSGFFAGDSTGFTFENVAVVYKSNNYGGVVNFITGSGISFNNTLFIQNGIKGVSTAGYFSRTVSPSPSVTLTNAYFISDGEPFQTDTPDNLTSAFYDKAVSAKVASDANVWLNSFNSVMPSGFGADWSFNADGDLCFSGEVLIEYVGIIEGSKNLGELFYFSKDVTTPTGYANEYVKDGFYNIAMPETFSETKIDTLTIGATEVTGFTYADKVLKVPTSAISSLANGDVEIFIAVEDKEYKAMATVADLVLYNETDLQLIKTAGSKHIVLDGDITCTTAYGDRASVQFKGVLDGKGYAIKDIVYSAIGGLVFQAANATFKNLAMLNVQFNADYRGGALSFEGASVTVDNVAVVVSKANSHSGLFEYIGSGTNVIKNSVIVIEQNSSVNYGALSKTYANNNKALTISVANTYGVSGNTMMILTEDTSAINVDYAAINAFGCADIATLKTKSENLKNFDSNYWSIDASGNICFGGEIVVNA